MRLHRDLSGGDLARTLEALGYEVTRQTGSHMRLTTQQHEEHHLTAPRHGPLRVGTLATILDEAARHFEMTRAKLLAQLFGEG